MICEAIRLVTDRFIGSFPNFSNWTKNNDKIVLKHMTPKKRSPVKIFRYKELNTVLKSSPISWVDWLDVERFSNSKIDFTDMLSRCNVHLSIYDSWKMLVLSRAEEIIYWNTKYCTICFQLQNINRMLITLFSKSVGLFKDILNL